MWFLYATCGIPDPDLTEPAGFAGVDPGIANIATTGDGTPPFGGDHHIIPVIPESLPENALAVAGAVDISGVKEPEQ